MAKKARKPSTQQTRPAGRDDADVPVVGGREPCPCGSGKRYKACHGRVRAHAPTVLVRRPFEGLPGEVDWVAMREVVPAATASVRLRRDALPEDVREGAPETVTVATVLPLAWPALRRADGAVLVGLQSGGGSGDPSRDVAAALLRALAAEPGTPVAPGDLPVDGPRLQDLVEDGSFDVTVHPGFEFWVEGADDPDAQLDPEVRASLERANAAVVPTQRLTTVDGAYWCRIGDRAHLRWVLAEDEERLLDAIARLHARGESSLGEGRRYVGAFRAHGLVVPVWDVLPGDEAADVEDDAAAWRARLDAALADTSPLTVDERRARAGVVSRQLTLS